MDFFTFQRCLGEEQRILRRYIRLEIQLSALLRKSTVIRLPLVLSIQTLTHGTMQQRSMQLAM